VHLCIIALFTNCLNARGAEVQNTGSNITTDLKSHNNFEAPYPFTSIILWQKISQLLTLPEGYITKEDVERLMQVNLTLEEEYFETDYSYRQWYRRHYTASRGVNWYFNLSVFEGFKHVSEFNFRWGQPIGISPEPFPLAPENMCILAKDVILAIEENGWKKQYELTDSSHGIPPGLTYTKGSAGNLTVFFRFKTNEEFNFSERFTKSCLNNLTIQKQSNVN